MKTKHRSRPTGLRGREIAELLDGALAVLVLVAVFAGCALVHEPAPVMPYLSQTQR